MGLPTRLCLVTRCQPRPTAPPPGVAFSSHFAGEETGPPQKRGPFCCDVSASWLRGTQPGLDSASNLWAQSVRLLRGHEARPVHLALGWAGLACCQQTQACSTIWKPHTHSQAGTPMSQLRSPPLGSILNSLGTQGPTVPVTGIILGGFESTGFTLPPTLASGLQGQGPDLHYILCPKQHSANIYPITLSPPSLPANTRCCPSPSTQATGLGGRGGACLAWPSQGVFPVMSASSGRGFS